MRSSDQRDAIIAHFSPPFAEENFLSPTELDYLISLFNTGRNKIHKNTGPVTLNIHDEHWSDPVLANIRDRLHSIIGEFNIFAAFFFYVETPHIIHNDDSFELPEAYKGITIPLQLTHRDGFQGEPSLCFFNQYYLEGPSKFFNGDTGHIFFHNLPVYSYDQVYRTTTDRFPEAIHAKYLSHLKSTWLTGLSFDVALPWTPGNALIFDSVRLHCASNFRTQGVKSKLGISIFTMKS